MIKKALKIFLYALFFFTIIDIDVRLSNIGSAISFVSDNISSIGDDVSSIKAAVLKKTGAA